jgi:Flp pilus assembly CpaF family ATPase
MSDNHHDDEPTGAVRHPRKDADKGREPQFIPAQMGRRLISLNALVERIEAAFIEAYDGTQELREADTMAKRLKLVLETTDYIMSVESAQLSEREKAAIVYRVQSNLFSYGPLDSLFLDNRITTISLEGANQASVRYGHDELVSLGSIFQSADHFKRVIKRLMMDAGAELRDDHPYMEVGLKVGDRPVCVNLVAPPVAFQLTADIRVHPASLPTWDDLIASDFLTEQAVTLLKALMTSPHGLLIVGESESGKTTLLSLLAGVLPDPARTIAVERAGELRLPEGTERLEVKWPLENQPGLTFGEQIQQALDKKPACILLDEVRSDEPLMIAPLLQMPDAPRQIWSFRGAIFAKRLQSSLGMLARRADTAGGELLVKALYERLPFVATVSRVGGKLRLWSIGEWQFKHSPDYPTYTLLMQVTEGRLRFTGERPMRPLELPSQFWET